MPATDSTDARGRTRVAVTGLGVKTPAGTDLDTFWSRLLSGRSTAATIQRYDPSPLPVRIGCEVLDFDPTAYLGAEGGAPRSTASTQLGVAAAADALADAGDPGADPARCAVILGTGIGGLITLEEQITHLRREGRGPGQPVPRADDDDERDRGHRRDAARLDRPEPLHLHRVRGERARDRRSGAADPRRRAPTS